MNLPKLIISDDMCFQISGRGTTKPDGVYFASGKIRIINGFYRARTDNGIS